MDKFIQITFNTFKHLTQLKTYEIQRIESECKAYNLGLKIIPPDSMMDIQDSKNIVGSINMSGYCIDSHLRYHRMLEIDNIPVLNSVYSSQIADDKMLCYLELKKFSIPCPFTLSCELFYSSDIDKLMNILENKIGYPMVFKLTNSGLGYGVIKISNRFELCDYLYLAKMTNGLTGNGMTNFTPIVQKFVDCGGESIRVMMLEDRCLGATMRYNTQGYWKIGSSVSGWVREKFLVDNKLLDLSVSIMKILNLNYAGLDFFKVNDQYIFCEANSAPNYKPFETAWPEINISRQLVEYLIQKGNI